VDIAAPGVRIAGPAAAGGGYLFSEEGGTSFATAYVSGVAALIRSYDPSLTPKQVTDRLTRTAEHPAEHWNQQVGYGLVDPTRAGRLPRTRGRRTPVPPDGLGPSVRGASDRSLAVAATWIGVVGGTVVVLLLVALPVVRLGRRRGWRPPASSAGPLWTGCRSLSRSKSPARVPCGTPRTRRGRTGSAPSGAALSTRSTVSPSNTNARP
jgi:subtilisin family serine protease